MSTFTYYDDNLEELDVPGTEDFTYVSGLFAGGYEWAQLGVYYSRSRRRYFWLSDYGCSCTEFGDGVRSIDDLENGERAAARAAISRFAEREDLSSEKRQRALREFATFNEEAAR